MSGVDRLDDPNDVLARRRFLELLEEALVPAQATDAGEEQMIIAQRMLNFQ